MKLELVPKQAALPTPQLIQSVEILQMSSQELMEFASRSAEENPVLELGDAGAGADGSISAFAPGAGGGGSRYSGGQDGDEAERVPDYSRVREETLFQSVCKQLQALELPRELRGAAAALAESLDESGRLDESLSSVAEYTGYPEPALERALGIIQSLDPAGLGARSLSECLLLQLERYYPDEALAAEIARSHLEALSRGRYKHIADRTGASREQVAEACGIIRSLEPRPGSRFFAAEAPEYIIPDVMVSYQQGRFEVKVNEAFIPALSINGYYSRMAKSSDDPEVRSYLSEKLRQAKWLIAAIEQRHRTLRQCVECLVRIQEQFFINGSGSLVPMSLSDIAAELGVHESTVSRALKGRYLQCPTGVLPLSRFFSRSFSAADGTGAVSPDRVKALLKELILAEDKRRPLSDRKLCERLNAAGCAVSRRTVAKYRDAMRIPGASARRLDDGG